MSSISFLRGPDWAAQVSRNSFSQLEKGAFYASLKIVGRLAEALGVEPAELLKRGAPDNRCS
jgi:transcriptional regulator with XRE-family HTH domain